MGIEDKGNKIKEAIDIVSQLSGGPGLDVALDESRCVLCGNRVNPDTDFTDMLSQREWEVSHACQPCQDKMFADPEDV